MNGLDWTILAILALSTLISLKRGFVKEALSLLAWVAAFLVSTTLAGRLSAVLVDTITNDAFRQATAYVILFAATLMLGSLLNTLLAQVIRMTGLSGADRVLGTAFGLARGLVLVMVIVFVMQSLLESDEQAFMRDSRLLPHLVMVQEWARDRLDSLDGADMAAKVSRLKAGSQQ
ncbi:MAG: CvpA family protein [Pseudomonadota bacterium]